MAVGVPTSQAPAASQPMGPTSTLSIESSSFLTILPLFHPAFTTHVVITVAVFTTVMATASLMLVDPLMTRIINFPFQFQ